MFTGSNNQAKPNAQKNYQTQSEIMSDDWGLNPAFYQNMASDNVDWAALAAKWIQMKETLPQTTMPAAPPPPSMSMSALSSRLDEQGEAPMEVEKDDDIPVLGNSEAFSASSNSAQNQVWATAASWSSVPQTQWRHPAWEHNWQTESSPQSQAVPGTVSIANTTPSESKKISNYWPNKTYKTVPQETNKIPGLMDEVIKMDNSDDEASNAAAMESAKRKLLPAWIREGLEKMEREKQKMIEREKEMKEREKMLEERRRLEEEALSELQKSNQAFVPKSKFDSDSDAENVADDANDIPDNVESREPSPSPPIEVKLLRPREELIQEIMLSVRKNLTEILLEVTNEEIASLAKETLSKTRRKAPTAQALRKTALSSLTGGLGLGIYADSSDSESDGGGSSKRDDDEDGTDTETELILQETVRRKKREFEATILQIDAEIELREAEDERKNRENEREREREKEREAIEREKLASSSKIAMQREGETQPNDKLYSLQKQSGRGKSRFSDVNDTVRNTHITHVAIIPEQPGQPISIVPIGGSTVGSNSMNPAQDSDSSGGRSSSSRHKKKKSKKHKKHKRKSDDEDHEIDSNRRTASDYSSQGRRRSRSQESRKTVRHSHRRSRSPSRLTPNRSRSRSRSRRDRDERSRSRSRRDRKYSSSSSHRTSKRSRSRSKSRDRYRRRSRSRSRHRR